MRAASRTLRGSGFRAAQRGDRERVPPHLLRPHTPRAAVIHRRRTNRQRWTRCFLEIDVYNSVCSACSTRTPRYASDHVLIRLNTGALLKRAALGRKKYAGGETHKRSTSSNHTSLTLVFLGRFPMRPVTQSASSCGLASWTGQYLLACFTRVRLGASHCCPCMNLPNYQ